MANWCGTARSNYVRIKDLDGLKKALAPFSIQIGEEPEGVWFCPSEDGDDGGGWPSVGFSEEDEDEDEIGFDPAVQICPFMEPGQVLVLQESGAEKLRYVTGNATAYNCAGDHVQVNIDDIYERAAKAFAVDVKSIKLAQY